jgi:hypothetical protein
MCKNAILAVSCGHAKSVQLFLAYELMFYQNLTRIKEIIDAMMMHEMLTMAHMTMTFGE